MFILRQVSKDEREFNKCLGDHYNFIARERNKEEFNRITDRMGDFPKKDECFGFLIYGNGGDEWPMYEGQKYYIMTETGKTFSNLSHR